MDLGSDPPAPSMSSLTVNSSLASPSLSLLLCKMEIIIMIVVHSSQMRNEWNIREKLFATCQVLREMLVFVIKELVIKREDQRTEKRTSP